MRYFKVIFALYILLVFGVLIAAAEKQTVYFLELTGDIPYTDKAAHIVFLGFLSFCMNISCNLKRVNICKHLFLLGSVISFSMLSLEEFSQLFIPGRTFEIADLVANGVGVILWGLVARLVLSKTASFTNILANTIKFTKASFVTKV